MPTNREREYYRMGFQDGLRVGRGGSVQYGIEGQEYDELGYEYPRTKPRRRRRPQKPKKKRTTLSAWQKFVKANSKKKEFRIRGKKLNFKKLGIAYRKKTGKRKGKK